EIGDREVGATPPGEGAGRRARNFGGAMAAMVGSMDRKAGRRGAFGEALIGSAMLAGAVADQEDAARPACRRPAADMQADAGRGRVIMAARTGHESSLPAHGDSPGDCHAGAHGLHSRQLPRKVSIWRMRAWHASSSTTCPA